MCFLEDDNIYILSCSGVRITNSPPFSRHTFNRSIEHIADYLYLFRKFPRICIAVLYRYLHGTSHLFD